MKSTDENYNDFLHEMELVWGKDKRMISYCIQSVSRVIKLTDSDNIVSFKQPSIHKDFCFGYSTCGQGAEYDEAVKAEINCNNNMEKYFMDHNIRRAGYQERIDNLNDESKSLYIAVACIHGSMLVDYICENEHIVNSQQWKYQGYKLSQHQQEDKLLIAKALEAEKIKHEKRLSQWWKRYGAAKCRTWVYWIDE